MPFKKFIRLASVVAAYLCITSAAMAQNAGTVSSHAFAVGKGPGVTGFSSLLCTSAQIAVGQSAADPICRTLSGDVTISAAGVTAIGAGVVHSAMLNADVFSTAHSWSAVQSFSTLVDLLTNAAPATPASGHGSAWYDSTDLRLHDKNASGTIGTTVVASSCGAHQWDNALSIAGVLNCAQPGFSDISGSLATAQLPGLASALIWVGNVSGVATAVSMGGDCTISNAGSITCTKTSGVALGPFATIASQTANAIYKGNGAAAPVVSGLTDDGTKVSTSETMDLAGQAQAIEVANAGTTGTTLNKLAKLTGAPSTAVITATTDAGGVVGIVVAGAGTTGNAILATHGTASCVFDGATVAGDYVQISGSVAGDCHDAGSTYPTSGQVIGRVVSTNAAGGTFAVIINDEIRAASGGGGGVGTVTITGGGGIAVSGACNSSVTITCAIAQRAVTVSVVTPTSHTGGFSANGSGTYTTPAGVQYIEIHIVGGGGGGGGGNNVTAATSGNPSCWNTTGAACTTPLYQAGGGAGGVVEANPGLGAAGGTIAGSGTCDWSVAGGMGGSGGFSIVSTTGNFGGKGGDSSLGGGASGTYSTGTAGSGAANSGGGGGGGGVSGTASVFAGTGGGAGATCHVVINSPAGTYTYVAAATAAGAAAGTNGGAGGAGAGGQIIIYEH